jgi:hypothetical protein
MKRIAQISILSLILSAISFISAQAEPMIKSEKIVINYQSGSSDMAFEDIERIIRIGSLVRSDNGSSLVFTRTAYDKKVGATKAMKRLTKQRLASVLDTAKAGFASASFPAPTIKTYSKATAPKRNRIILLATWNVPAPTIVTIAPNFGSILGGTSVSIAGTEFRGITSVTFGAVAATSFVVNSPTRITAVVPSRALQGEVDVVVTGAGGVATSVGGFSYRQASISSVSPLTGSTAGGTSVLITGANLTGATAVSFGGSAATSFVVNSDSQITAVTPTRPAGSATILVTTPAGTVTASQQFSYVSPSISTLSPIAGSISGGNSVVISGNNLLGSTAVSFGGSAASSFVVNSNTQITAVAPARPAGAVIVAVTTPVGIVNATYTYFATPTITSITPLTGSTGGGSSVVITGANFLGITGVSFGGTSATSFTVNSTTQITATTPARAAGASQVQVTNPGGSATSPSNFTYFAPPSISSISPNTGSNVGGTTVVITGTNLTGVTAVRFGAAAATSFTVNSATQITAITPVGTIGTVTVQVVAPGGNANGSFTYSVSAPTISSLNPASGSTAGGNSVVITGTNLLAASSVSFGGTAALSFNINSATQITAVAPARAAGAITLTVTTPGGSATASYTYSTTPTITSMTPLTGTTSGAVTVTITGTNFLGATGVTFGGVNASSFTVVSATQVTAVTPARVAGGVTVDVITPGGTARASDVFTYVAGAPTISAVSPITGNTAGGTTITITGTNLIGTTSLTVGGIAATSVTVLSATQVTAITPAGTAGVKDIVLSTAGGSVTSAGSFTYAAPPVITSFTPGSGLLAGGETITVTGTGFTGTFSVTFGGTAAPIVSVSDTQVVVTSPARAAGAVKIVITTNIASATSAADYTYS